MNTLLANIDRIFFIADVNYIFFEISVVINPILGLFLLLILIQSLNSQ